MPKLADAAKRKENLVKGSGLRRSGLCESAVDDVMALGEESLQAVAMHGELMIFARDKMSLLELDQMLSDSRARRTDQFREIAMPRVHGEFDSLAVADSKVLAQFEQDQREAFLERATHEVRASQLDQIPAAEITGRHPLEVFRVDAERYLDKFFQLDGSDLAIGHCLAAEVVVDPDHPGGKPGIIPGATIISKLRTPWRLRQVNRATP